MIPAQHEQPVRVPAGPVVLEGDLAMPAGARALVLFAHGSGSSRLSPRNRHVARTLRDSALGTLLIDLLTRDEEVSDASNAHLRFDVALLARRLGAIMEWLGGRPATSGCRLGLFGASTGAAAALLAAAERPEGVGAVVSRGGRPDLAGAALERVRAPTLLIVGGRDAPVVELNQQALPHLGGPKALEIVPGASHLFEEPGALDHVARLAAGWFTQYLLRPAQA